MLAVASTLACQCETSAFLILPMTQCSINNQELLCNSLPVVHDRQRLGCRLSASLMLHNWHVWYAAGYAESQGQDTMLLCRPEIFFTQMLSDLGTDDLLSRDGLF